MRIAYHESAGRVDFGRELKVGELVDVVVGRVAKVDTIETCRVESSPSGSLVLHPMETRPAEDHETHRKGTPYMNNLHPEPVADALASAGLSRNSELDDEYLERARKLADGEVTYSTESARRAYIMGATPKQSAEEADAESEVDPSSLGSSKSEVPQQQEEAEMADNGQDQKSNGRRGRGPDPKSNRQRILKSALKAIQGSEETEDHPAGQMTRSEIDKAVRVKSSTKATPADWVADAVRNDVVVDGHGFTKEGRGLYGVREVEAA